MARVPWCATNCTGTANISRRLPRPLACSSMSRASFLAGGAERVRRQGGTAGTRSPAGTPVRADLGLCSRHTPHESWRWRRDNRRRTLGVGGGALARLRRPGPRRPAPVRRLARRRRGRGRPLVRLGSRNHPAAQRRDAPGQALAGGVRRPGRVPRILRLLDHHRVPASFFVPAVSALLHPEEIPACVAAGHEIALHGWIHEWNTVLDRATERDLLFRSIDVLERLSGSRPTGIRTPSWDFSEHTLDLIREAQLTYDLSLMADDEPYELLADGADGHRRDPRGMDPRRRAVPDHGPIHRHPPVHAAARAPADLDRRVRARPQDGLFQLTMHPHLIGHRSRIVVLEELLEHISAAGGAWFARHDEIAASCLATVSYHPMRFGLFLPPFAEFADPKLVMAVSQRSRIQAGTACSFGITCSRPGHGGCGSMGDHGRGRRSPADSSRSTRDAASSTASVGLAANGDARSTLRRTSHRRHWARRRRMVGVQRVR